MAKKVVLSERNGFFRAWASQFAASDSDHEVVVAGQLRRSASHQAKLSYIRRYYGAAARAAGTGGTVIISLGHGGSRDTDSSVGMVDLLPDQSLRIQRDQANYPESDAQQGYQSLLRRSPHLRPQLCRRILQRYDLNDSTRRPEPPQDSMGSYFDCRSFMGGAAAARTNELFILIGEVLSEQRVSKVVLLTCRVGNATSFLNRISRSWNCITIAAYSERVAANNDGEADTPYYLYLVNHESRKYRTDIPNRLLHETNATCATQSHIRRAG